MTTETAVTVVEALARVMGDVQAVRKGDRNQQQGFNFRGIDSVVNAVGPALRAHGVVAVPTSVVPHFEQYETRSGTQMRSAVLTITWRFYGPLGDHIEAQTIGEASDAGDKSVSKAHSVAYRIALLQALCIPTDEPDPDTFAHERASARVTSGKDWAADATMAADADELRAIYKAAVASGEMTRELAGHITKLSDAFKAAETPAAEPVESPEAVGEQPALDGSDPWTEPAK